MQEMYIWYPIALYVCVCVCVCASAMCCLRDGGYEDKMV